MPYPSLPSKPPSGAQWTELGDAIHAAIAQAISDLPGIRTDLSTVKASTNTAAAELVSSASPTFTGTITGITKSMIGLGNVDNTSDSARTITAGQVTSGTLSPARLPAGCFAVRRRTVADEAAPTATNWQPRPVGYPAVLNVGAAPAPADASADDLHVALASATSDAAAVPIALNDGSVIPVWPGSTTFNAAALVGSVQVTGASATTRDAYLSVFPASKHLSGFRQIAANICALLYASPADVPTTVPTLTLDFSGAAGVLAQTWRGEARIEFGSGSVGASVTASYTTHEMVHLFGNGAPYGSSAQARGVIEGIADWVLIQLGYHTVANQRPSGGGTSWDAGYDTTAFFLDYVEKHAPTPTPGFVRALNATLTGSTWGPAVITGINARRLTVEQLWAEYKAWLAPAPTPTLPFTDRLTVSYTAAGQTSNYHAWAAGLSAGAGLLIWLHGDDAYEHKNPNSTYVFGGTNGVRALAKARGYIVVSALTPDTTGSLTWWESGSTRSDYLKALIQDLVAGYAANPNRVIIAGFSGGAQQTTQYFMPRWSSILTGGASIVFGGGGAPVVTVQPIPTALKSKWYMHWATGALDDAAHSSEGYDALGYAKAGANWYEAQGFTVGRQWIPGATHDIDGQFGGIVANVIDSRGLGA